EALSSRMQRLLLGMEAVHDNSANRGSSMLQDDLISVTHPVVIEDDVTHQRALYVNSVYTKRLVGMSEPESDAILAFPSAHVSSPEFSIRVTWEPGTVVVWDERLTQHFAVPNHVGRRIVKRVTIEGGVPRAAAA